MEDLSCKKRARVDSDDFEFGSQEVKRLKDDLLVGLLDDSDLCTTTQDLESFMKSFEEEIRHPPAPPVTVVSESGESQPELGFLLGASDDELGLPPTTTADTNGSVESELFRLSPGSPALSEFLGFGDEISYFDTLEYGMEQGNNGESDGVFDYSDLGMGSSSEFSWHQETLPAQ